MADGMPTTPGARTPSCPFSSQRAAAMLFGLGGLGGGSVASRCALTSAQPDCERPISALMAACASELEADEDAQQGAGGSRKDKSLGLLCDNFLQLFASGHVGATIELEAVADKLGVGRRRICALPARPQHAPPPPPPPGRLGRAARKRLAARRARAAADLCRQR